MLERIAKFFIVVLFVGLAAFAIYLIVEGGKAPATQPVVPLVKPTPAPAPAPEAVVATSYPDALAKAKSLKRKIFIYVGAPWCVPCQQMKAQTLADAGVKAALAKYVTLTIDFDANKRLARLLNATDLPGYLIGDADRAVIKQSSGFKNPADFLAWIGN